MSHPDHHLDQHLTIIPFHSIVVCHSLQPLAASARHLPKGPKGPKRPKRLIVAPSAASTAGDRSLISDSDYPTDPERSEPWSPSPMLKMRHGDHQHPPTCATRTSEMHLFEAAASYLPLQWNDRFSQSRLEHQQPHQHHHWHWHASDTRRFQTHRLATWYLSHLLLRLYSCVGFIPADKMRSESRREKEQFLHNRITRVACGSIVL